ncbi:chloride channel protein CLC-e isoform X3 [Cynara cardunculus var. scolymus]|uniref:chloride channel protein CLC-e isoform X3 n=1 Tax=Cynara cardunculus var. scolymus TaxID=59895 RepID=UPI000D6305BF|nr:chloride channel protein CLC-e isoform X3 [Cynara cardunculus var. scolymus]
MRAVRECGYARATGAPISSYVPIARHLVLQASYSHHGLSSLSLPLFCVAGGFKQNGYNGLCFHPRPLSISWVFGAGKPENIILARATEGDQWRQGQEDFGDYEQAQQPEVGSEVLKEEIALLGGNTGIISACFVGLVTGVCVVLFNNVVQEIRDLCWDGIPSRGASWLRELPYENTWEHIILIPTCGGLVVSLLNMLRSALDAPKEENSADSLKAVLKPILKAVAAAVTLGTGNSLGPEGPSVEIGASVAKGVGSLFDRDAQRELSLRAAGSAAGISSGFNAAVAGCFFAVESVLWPSPAESYLSLTNTTSTVILSAVIASVVSEIGLGSEPAFTVPDYDFRSPSELPLYLLLGIFCGLVSLSFSWCTSLMMVVTDKIQKTFAMPKAVFPVVGGFTIGLIALIYPEVLYWGFENVDTLLESRPLVKGLSVDLLLQLIAIKIAATSFCRACGLVGGYYAPSLFIGAATGMVYGKIISFMISQLNPIFHLSGIEVASPQAYGLVGMAATLAGVCQVPLTAVLLLFELTQDYRIVLPLLGAVGLSSWITSRSIKRTDVEGPEGSLDELSPVSYSFDGNTEYIAKKLLVSQAMRSRYVTVLMSTMLTEVVALMLEEKQSCAMIVDDNNLLIGLLTLGDIQEFCKLSEERNKIPEVSLSLHYIHVGGWLQEVIVSELCSLNGFCKFPPTVTPKMNLYSAELIMNTHGTTRLPVVSEYAADQRALPVGILDRECINIACRALATRERLVWFSTLNNPRT